MEDPTSAIIKTFRGALAEGAAEPPTAQTQKAAEGNVFPRETKYALALMNERCNPRAEKLSRRDCCGNKVSCRAVSPFCCFFLFAVVEPRCQQCSLATPAARLGGVTVSE